MGRGWGGIYRTSGSGGHCEGGQCHFWPQINSISVGSKRVVLEVSQSKIPKIQVGYTCSHRTVIMPLHAHAKLLPLAATVNLLKHQILGCCGCKLNETVGLTHFTFDISSCGSWAVYWDPWISNGERNLIQGLTTPWHKQKKVEGCSTWDLGPGAWGLALSAAALQLKKSTFSFNSHYLLFLHPIEIQVGRQWW